MTVQVVEAVEAVVLPIKLMMMMGYNPFPFNRKVTIGRYIPMTHAKGGALRSVGFAPRTTCGDLTEWGD